MLTRLGAATWLTCLAILALRAPDVGATVERAGGASFPDALVAVLEIALLLLAAWTGAVLSLCALGGHVAATAARLVPYALRGLLVAGVAGALTTQAAQADPGGPRPHDVARVDYGTGAAALDGLVLPERPTSSGSDDVAQHPASDRTEPGGPGGPGGSGSTRTSVRVAPGDTLWSIAARHLGPDASTAEVARATLQWHEANREVLGDDPDLVRPGQRLVAPRGQS